MSDILRTFIISFISAFLTAYIIAKYDKIKYLTNELETSNDFRYFVIGYIEYNASEISNFVKNRYEFSDDYDIYKERFINHIIDRADDIVLRFAESRDRMELYVPSRCSYSKSFIKSTKKVILNVKDTEVVNDIIRYRYLKYKEIHK